MRVDAICLKHCTRNQLSFYDKVFRDNYNKYNKLYRVAEQCEKVIDEFGVIVLMTYGFSEQQAKKVVEQARKVK